MARDPGLEELLTEDLAGTANLTTRPMFGGLVWLCRGHLLCGARTNELLIRLGAGQDGWALDLPDIVPMSARGRTMRGWIRADHRAYADDELRRRLLNAALSFVRFLPPKVSPMPDIPWDFPDGPGHTARSARARRSKA